MLGVFLNSCGEQLCSSCKSTCARASLLARDRVCIARLGTLVLKHCLLFVDSIGTSHCHIYGSWTGQLLSTSVVGPQIADSESSAFSMFGAKALKRYRRRSKKTKSIVMAWKMNVCFMMLCLVDRYCCNEAASYCDKMVICLERRAPNEAALLPTFPRVLCSVMSSYCAACMPPSMPVVACQ